MKTYDLYGTSALTPSRLVDVLATLLGLEFTQHDSDFRGVYYRAGDLADEHFVILPNEGDDEDDLPEPECAEPVLLEVNATTRPEVVRRLLAQVPELSLLRSRVI